MTTEQKIKKALVDIEMAQTHNQEAANLFYRAKVRLESVYSPAGPKRAKALNNGQVAHVVNKRNNNIRKQQTKTV